MAMKYRIILTRLLVSNLVTAVSIPLPPTEPSIFELLSGHPKSTDRESAHLFQNATLPDFIVGKRTESTFNAACGLESPTAELWVSKHAEIKTFVDENEAEFKKNPTSPSFAVHFRNKYAPKLAPSSVFCDVAGACSIGSCDNLDETLPVEGRQIIYLVFEQLSGVAHIMAVSAKATNDAGSFIKGTVDWLVDKFTTADEIEKALNRKHLIQKIVMAAVNAVVLIDSGGTAFPPLYMADSFGLKFLSAAANIIGSSYIGAAGIVNAGTADVPDYSAGVKSWLTGTLNTILENRQRKVDEDLRDLLKGGVNSKNMTIFDLLSSKDFLAPDPDLQVYQAEREKQYLLAVSVNAAWHFERPYIIDADAPPGGCESDNRGPVERRVCLREAPTNSFWLFNIGQGREGGSLKNDRAQVTAPSGWYMFDDTGSQTLNVTRKCVVRSSLMMDRNNLADAVDQSDFVTISSALERKSVVMSGIDAVHWSGDPEKTKHLGSVPGTFSIPIFRNPGGEAISSVGEDKSRNYPCMSGEFLWESGWSIEKDTTLTFLKRSGLMFSENWEDYCSGHNGCEGENEGSVCQLSWTCLFSCNFSILAADINSYLTPFLHY
ncbi:hypothetical protein HBI88_015220 [Parastagonospora nodorum]|nr:hypothetical protein HBH72_104830 [Parastagonospora nodorum]KAH5205824.1 hypothetical protein HBH68_093930 [Parastagonospora nodorum]KAH5371317.1 hypothetical protein HBI48_040030 [Parastagonospora nodorum]KAH5749569.1 hypothetical protein HBI17_106570 [Parastagonospora nodorum]KAH5776125.1 hypothetical protein HBI97_131830 [Parastagonospora nodorum]